VSNDEDIIGCEDGVLLPAVSMDAVGYIFYLALVVLLYISFVWLYERWINPICIFAVVKFFPDLRHDLSPFLFFLSAAGSPPRPMDKKGSDYPQMVDEAICTYLFSGRCAP
jgi:hypothetical protein